MTAIGFTLSLDSQLVHKLDEIAQSKGITARDLVRLILDNHVSVVTTSAKEANNE